MDDLYLTLIWLIAIVSIVVGVLGTIIPALPGTPMIFAGMFLIAWWQDFAIIGILPLVILAALSALAIVVDFVASALGARRVGASNWAIVGATLGSIIGMFFFIPGLIIGPFVGAVAGELFAQSTVQQAARVGIATWIGLLIGTALKVDIVAAMIGIFISALLV